jgi:hypothetical protein
MEYVAFKKEMLPESNETGAAMLSLVGAANSIDFMEINLFKMSLVY